VKCSGAPLRLLWNRHGLVLASAPVSESAQSSHLPRSTVSSLRSAAAVPSASLSCMSKLHSPPRLRKAATSRAFSRCTAAAVSCCARTQEVWRLLGPPWYEMRCPALCCLLRVVWGRASMRLSFPSLRCAWYAAMMPSQSLPRALHCTVHSVKCNRACMAVLLRCATQAACSARQSHLNVALHDRVEPEQAAMHGC